MTSPDELRDKWFLDFRAPQYSFPPAARYPGAAVKNYTDGNNVTPLIDGKDYMEVWYRLVCNMRGQPDCEIYHAAWRLDAVRTLGYTKPGTDALKLLTKVKRSGVKLYILTSPMNYKSTAKLLLRGIRNAGIDMRSPRGNNNHQKYICFKRADESKAMVGSLDISYTRWDSSGHNEEDRDRDPVHGKVTHDAGVLIEGPAAADIERSFRGRWNDPSRTKGILPAPKHKITTPVSTPPPAGSHSVQVLHTYGRTGQALGYSWSPVGEFTLWASYLNAIKKAAKYIYIEDQYFLPFGWPPFFTGNGTARDSDIIYQLGEALKRGVKVVVLVPANVEDAYHIYINYQRHLGIQYLTDTAAAGPGDFVIASIYNDRAPIYVHSKLMICDDEFVILGSGNISQRSMTGDSELQIGIVDEKNIFAKKLRKLLWAEHFQGPCPDHPGDAFDTFKEKTISKAGRLRIHETNNGGRVPIHHGRIYSTLIDFYGGPPGRHSK
jgi:phosphatidylserine/phosphatidylglycerophosphate/cardiolipin synthase-like enzyme